MICIVSACGIFGYTSEAFNEDHTVSMGNIKNNQQTLDPEMNYRIREKLIDKFRQDYNWHYIDNKGGLDI
jgi:hypothetical protein